MGKRSNAEAVNRRGLIARYARIRGVPHAQAEQMTRTWHRSDFRELVERIESEERPYVGRRARSSVGQVSTTASYVTMVDGITR